MLGTFLCDPLPRPSCTKSKEPLVGDTSHVLSLFALCPVWCAGEDLRSSEPTCFPNFADCFVFCWLNLVSGHCDKLIAVSVTQCWNQRLHLVNVGCLYFLKQGLWLTWTSLFWLDGPVSLGESSCLCPPSPNIVFTYECHHVWLFVGAGDPC